MELSKMFGVERDTDFGVKGYSVTFKTSTFLGEYEYLMYRRSAVLDWREAEGTLLCRVIAAAPAGIIHLPPPLTDEQREQLKAIWTLGGRWLAKDCDGVVNYYTKIPYKESGYWFDNDDAERYGYAIPLSAGVCELQELNDVDEPFDIGKALGVTK